MRGEKRWQRTMLVVVNVEQRISKEHPLRRIKQLSYAALKALSPIFDQMYSALGRPSIPTERPLTREVAGEVFREIVARVRALGLLIVLMIAMAGCGGASSSPTVAVSTPAPAPTVTLSPGANLQNAVDTAPAGTTFVLQPGPYRYASVNLTSSQNGDSFIGQTGAILDGAEVLSNWTQASINGIVYWTTAGGTPLPTPTPSCAGSTVPCCETSYPGCIYVQDLYVNGVEYQHVTSLGDVVAGQSWYYDFDGTDGGIQNNIYLAAGDDPNANVVELGDTSYAFAGNASDITIQNLTIEKYAAPLSTGVVQVGGPNWLIQNNQILLNHGVGLSDLLAGTYVQVLGNNILYNGEVGCGGPGSYGLWDSNTIAYNNTDRVNIAFEGDGTKFVGSNVTISNNVAHDNYGTGLHVDGGATYVTISNNTSYNNLGGIRYEVSQYGTITNNIVYGNTPQTAISWAGSAHGRISGNTVVDTGGGGIFITNIVGTRPNSIVYEITDVQVTGNTVWVSPNDNVAAGMADFAIPPEPSIFTDPTNFFDYNVYQFPVLSRAVWLWGESTVPPTPISWAVWQGLGQDPHGQVVLNVPVPY
jgi:parallel beta-helix repeat protein